LNGTVLPNGAKATSEQRYSLAVGDIVIFGSVALRLEK